MLISAMLVVTNEPVFLIITFPRVITGFWNTTELADEMVSMLRLTELVPTGIVPRVVIAPEKLTAPFAELTTKELPTTFPITLKLLELLI